MAIRLFLLCSVIMLSANHVIQAQDAVMEADSLNITAVAWSPDGTRIAAAGSTSNSGYLQVLEIAAGRVIYQLETNPGGFTSIAWSPDGRYLAAGGYDQAISVIDVVSGKHVATLRGHQSTVTAVDWNLDGTQLVSSGNWDGLTILWDVTSFQLLRVLEARSLFPFAVRFDPGAQRIAVGGEGGIRIYSAVNNSESATTYRSDLNVSALAWSRDGSKIAFGTQVFRSVVNPDLEVSSQVNIIDVVSGTLLSSFETHDLSIYGIAWTTDSKWIATHSEGGNVRIWDAATGSQIAQYEGTKRYFADVAFSAYNGRLAYGKSVPLAVLNDIRAYNLPLTAIDGAVQIVVPAPSLERLASIQAACSAQSETAVTFAAPQAESDLDAYIAQVASADQLPPACAADLIAVAEALQAQE